MHIVIFTHPPFLELRSMQQYAVMLGEGMEKRGHQVSYWTAEPFFFQIPVAAPVKKWFSYIDQYLLFPLLIRYRMRKNAKDTLYVFTDHALGPWIPVVADRPHVVHCHDFLAQFSAEGRIAENSVGWSGRKFQSFIRWGFRKGKNFISISDKTRRDLHLFLSESAPVTSKMIHNGLNPIFKPYSTLAARVKLTVHTGVDLMDGYLIHVGGNQWYKNRIGVIEIYNSWRDSGKGKLPLLLVGARPNDSLLHCYSRSRYRNDIHFVSGIDDKLIHLAYAGASLLLFPSYSEGFGWPVVEAMGSGCPVLTTDEETLRVVCGEAAFFIPPRPRAYHEVHHWAAAAAVLVNEILSFSEEVKISVMERGISNAARFDVENKLNEIEEVYKTILKTQLP